jgi:hypothetical protein
MARPEDGDEPQAAGAAPRKFGRPASVRQDPNVPDAVEAEKNIARVATARQDGRALESVRNLATEAGDSRWKASSRMGTTRGGQAVDNDLPYRDSHRLRVWRR